MGLFWNKKKPKIDFEISAEVKRVHVNNLDWERLQSGWKRDCNGILHEPDIVWISSAKSEVYHNKDTCCGVVISNHPIAIKETQAIRKGYRRCSKCDWCD